MIRWIASLVLLSALPAAAKDPYPLSLHVSASELISARASAEGADVDLAAQARGVYERVATSSFRPGGAGPALQLQIESVSGHMETAAAGYRVVVQHAIKLDDQGRQIARWEVRGEAATYARDAGGVAAAFASAAEDAAQVFLLYFDQSQEVASWMRSRGIELSSPRMLWPNRAVLVGYAEIGGAFVDGGDARAKSGFFRVGAGGKYLFAQVTAGLLSTPFTASPVFARTPTDFSIDALALGVDAGPILPIGSLGEIRAGAGVSWLKGHANGAYSFPPGSSQPAGSVAFAYSKVAPSAFVSMVVTPLVLRGGVRLRAGFELREYFHTDVEYAELNRTVSVAGLSAGLFVGAELPWGGMR